MVDTRDGRWHGRCPYGRARAEPRGLLATLGAGVLVHAFARFVIEGRGTPAPVAPTQHLVVGGLYRHVRNPMYLAVLSAIVGQAMMLGRRSLVLYAAAVGLAFVTFVRAVRGTDPRGDIWLRVRRRTGAVPGWWPRWRPWRPDPSPDARAGAAQLSAGCRYRADGRLEESVARVASVRPWDRRRAPDAPTDTTRHV